MKNDFWSYYTIGLLPGEVKKLRTELSVIMDDFRLFKDVSDEEFLQVFVRHQLLEVHKEFNYHLGELTSGVTTPKVR